MKLIILAITLLAIVSIFACIIPPEASTETPVNNTGNVSLVAPTTPSNTPIQTTLDNANEEAEIRHLVENFGKRLQVVSLQAPDAATAMQKQYSEFVSPKLLEMWMTDVFKAPGRMVSSPWPDRIEITSLLKESAGRYVITGFVIEVSSTEVDSGEAVAKIPVRIVLQKEQEHWRITEYAEEQ